MRNFHLVIFFFLLTTAQQGVAQVLVSGKVIDEAGEALIGATIQIKGTAMGTATDMDGNFTLEVPGTETILMVSMIGYTSYEIQVGNQSNITVTLAEDIKGLEEIIVVGYGTVRKSDLTGSVGSVEVDDIKKIASADVARTMQGKVAGVTITPNSGAPGSGTTIRVRGIGSFANADPLYVVDGFLTGDISNISPNDIASMEVLKDASATAIYGSRGSNGVIIVTTKKGSKNQGMVVDFNAYGGVQSAWNKLEMMDSKTYAQAYLTSVGGSLSDISEADLRSWIQDALAGSISGTDWQNEVLRVAPIQSYDLSLRGANNKLGYGLSGSYFNQQGIVHNTYGKRIQGNGYLDYTPLTNLKISVGLKFSQNDYTNYDQGTYSSVLGTSLRKDPINPIKEPTTGHWDRTGLTDIANPVRLMEEQQLKTSNAIRLQPTLSLNWEIVDGLTFNSSVTIDQRTINSTDRTPENITVQSRVLDENGNPTVNPNESRPNELHLKDKSTLDVLQFTNTLSYQKIFKSGHSINAVAGLETYQEQTSWNRDQIFVDSVGNVSYNERAYNLFSYFGRAVYSFRDRYLVTATIRRDGSSKFPTDLKYGTFPSFSLGWNIDQEEFYPQNDFLVGLKLRGGWGEVGNQSAIAPYRYFSTLSPDWRYAFNNVAGEQGFASTFLPATSITWETSSMTNFALDFLMLENKLSFTAEYYIKETKDLLVDANNVPSPVFAGAFAPATNAASMRNNGIELTLDYKQNFERFRLNVGGNISLLSNEVTSLGAGESISGANYEPKIGMPVTRTVVGEEFATFYGLKTLGIFQTPEEVIAHGSQPLAKPGDVIYQDTNGDDVINVNDAVALGSAIPEFTYGAYINAEYKQFDFSLSVIGSHGNEIANIFSFYIAGSSAVDNNLLTSRLDAWTSPGSTNSEPRLTNEVTLNDQFSDRYVEDGKYFRLRNLQIGYTLPDGSLSKLNVKSLRLYVSGDNLLTLTKYSGYDPEVGLAFNGDPFGAGVDLGNYPQPRTVIIGLNLKF
jgi:TonB-linked SusC/RagA family outer membrane protein